MPSGVSLISRAAARYLGARGQTITRELARDGVRQLWSGQGTEPPLAPAPPPSRPARAAYAAWLAALPLFGLAILNLDLFLPGETATAFRLLVGCVLLIEGALLLPRRSPFRTTMMARLGASSANQPNRMRQTARKHLVSAGLTLLGLAWIGAGSLDLLRGIFAR